MVAPSSSYLNSPVTPPQRLRPTSAGLGSVSRSGDLHGAALPHTGPRRDRPIAIASVIKFVANVPLNYMLIFGAWGTPELGAEGCGLATAASMWLSTLIILLYVQARTPASVSARSMAASPCRRRIGEILAVGLPVGFTFSGSRGLLRYHPVDRHAGRRCGRRPSNRHQRLGRVLHSDGECR